MKYFVEAKTADAVERVNALLTGQGIVPEWSSGQEDTRGDEHEVCEVYSLKNARLIRSMEIQDSRVRISYFKRETEGSRLESADYFVITRPAQVIRRSVPYKKAVGQLPKRRATA